MAISGSGIILTVNRESGYVVAAGKVAGTSSGESGGKEWYCVRLRYEDGGCEKETDVYFWNDPEAGDFRSCRADRARRKNLREGSSVVVRCRFSDASKHEATGYGIYYDGLIRIRPDEAHGADDRTVLAGTVTSMKDVTVRGEDGVRLNVYAGRAYGPDGLERYLNVSVTLFGEKAETARTDLKERDLGGGACARKKAVFRCGPVRTFHMSEECPACRELMRYDEASGQMECPACGMRKDPSPDGMREAVCAYDYIVTEERERRMPA